MGMPSDNEDWLIEFGHEVIEKKAKIGTAGLSDKERLVYSLWVSDYCMRNAGDLEQAAALYKNWQSDGLKSASNLRLPRSAELFSLPPPDFEAGYLSRFEAVCDEIRKT